MLFEEKKSFVKELTPIAKGGKNVNDIPASSQTVPVNFMNNMKIIK